MLITFEGPDGSGKTTQLALLAEFLGQQGYSLVRVREPGGTRIGEQIREVLHHIEHREMHPRAEVLLYSAARAQLVEEVIRPGLAGGQLVLCDRFYDSTFAYQGYGHQNDLDLIRRVLLFTTSGLTPDLSLLLDIDSEVGLRRRQKGGGEWNRLDAYQLELHKRVRQGYLQMAQAEPARWRVIDASQPTKVVQSVLQKTILDYLHLNYPK